jgi:hypothetical protein
MERMSWLGLNACKTAQVNECDGDGVAERRERPWPAWRAPIWDR